MAKLINGNGNTAIWAAQDADLIASICGNVTAIAAVGSQFSYTQEDANTIGVADGVIITKEGRRIQLDAGNVDLFTIPTGVVGVTNYYIIGYHLIQATDSSQTCEVFVQKMDSSTATITEDTFRGGATEVYVSLYRVTQVGMNIYTVNILLPSLNDLTEKVDKFANKERAIDYLEPSTHTWAQVLSDLSAVVDFTKITPQSILSVGATVYRLANSNRSNYAIFTLAQSSTSDFDIRTICINANASSNYAYISRRSSTSSFMSNNPSSSDFHVELWYE